MKKIPVIGSLNTDTVAEAPYMPKPGVAFIPGGRGANWAYASGKPGGT